MLLGENRRRHQHCSLPVVKNCLKDCPHGNLGLAVSDITTEEPVHRFVGFHIFFYVLNGLELVRCLFISKKTVKLAMQLCVCTEQEPPCHAPSRIQRQQFTCNLL